MADASKKEASKEKSNEPLDWSHQIDKLRENEPHNNTNKFVDSLISDAKGKAKKEGYREGFWNGFVVGVFAFAIVWVLSVL